MAAKAKESTPASQRVETLKNWVTILQGVATVLAIIAGAIWFYLQRSLKPQIEVVQTVTQRRLANDPASSLVLLDVRVKNIGKTLVPLEPGLLEVMQLNPAPGGPLRSYPLTAPNLEPGESNQVIFKAIQIPDSIKTIQLHTVYKVPGASGYWNLLSSADIGASASAVASTSSLP